MLSPAKHLITVTIALALLSSTVLVGMVDPAHAGIAGSGSADLALLPPAPVVWLPA